MQLVIDFYFYLYVYNSTCFERQALIIRSPSLYIQPSVSVFVYIKIEIKIYHKLHLLVYLLKYMKMHGPGNIKLF
jgi:hypothetical protein